MRADRARCRLALCLGLLATLGAACVDADSVELDASASAPMATTSTVVDGGGTLELGQATSTPRGNTVALVDAEVSPAGVHGLVEACAGPSAPEDVGVSLSFFALQLRDGSAISPTDPREAREPALRTQQLRPGTCTVGWLTFDAGDQPAPARYLVFGSQSAATRWDLRDTG